MLRRVKDEDVGRKTRPRFEVKPYVVVKDRHRGNYAVQRQREPQATVSWAHVDELKRHQAPANQVSEAKEQAEVAAQPEYVMEAVVPPRELEQSSRATVHGEVARVRGRTKHVGSSGDAKQ